MFRWGTTTLFHAKKYFIYLLRWRTTTLFSVQFGDNKSICCSDGGLQLCLMFRWGTTTLFHAKKILYLIAQMGGRQLQCSVWRQQLYLLCRLGITTLFNVFYSLETTTLFNVQMGYNNFIYCSDGG